MRDALSRIASAGGREEEGFSRQGAEEGAGSQGEREREQEARRRGR
jgi:hypothetical protein